MKKLFKGEPLDLLEASYFRCQRPIIYCDILFEKAINIERLKKAVKLTSKVVPEILCSYNINGNYWEDKALGLKDIVIKNFVNDYEWDLTNDVQLKIFIANDKRSLKVGISHLLCDGTGFKEYLYLLCEAYNKQNLIVLSNTRSAQEVLIFFHKKQRKIISSKIKEIHLLSEKLGNSSYSLKSTIDENEFIKIKANAKNLKVSINDMLIASYAMVLHNITANENFTITCPVNLRSFISNDEKTRTRICNLTGIYHCPININKNDSLQEVLKKVHISMQNQKDKNEFCCKLIKLHKAYKTIPRFLLKKMILKQYLIPPVSFTNIGIIDKEKLSIDGNKIVSCYITNSYRKFPAFQIAVSTYSNTCTISCNAQGSKENAELAKKILELTKQNLLKMN